MKFSQSNLTILIILKLREMLFPRSYKQRSLTKDAIYRLVRRKNAVILEIGAADGLDTAQFLTLFKDPEFRIIAIEPDSRNTSRFKKKITDPRATLVEAAISDTDGNSIFYLSSTQYSSSLKTPNLVELQKYWPEMTFEETTSVKTWSLDSLADDLDLSVIDFIWADVQGAEDLLISGGGQTLQRTRFFYTEYGGRNLYTHDVDLNRLLSLLGPQWLLLYDYKTDALFRNKAFDRK